MTEIFDPRTVYDPETMPTERMFNGTVWVKADWVLTEKSQKYVDSQTWNPHYARTRVVSEAMALGALPGAGIPGWDPLFTPQPDGADLRNGYEEKATITVGCTESPLYMGTPSGPVESWDFHRKVHHGVVEPTGFAEDPRIWRPEPEEGAPQRNIVRMIQEGVLKAQAEVTELHRKMLEEHNAKHSSWVARASGAAATPPPTWDDARKEYAERFNPPMPAPPSPNASAWELYEHGQRVKKRQKEISTDNRSFWKGARWHLWEAEEVIKEASRQRKHLKRMQDSDDKWQRVKPSIAFNAKWGQADPEVWERERVRAVFGDKGLQEGKTLEDIWALC